MRLFVYRGHRVHLEDLCLTFEYAPGSKVFGFHGADLRDTEARAVSPVDASDGDPPLVTMANLEDYIKLSVDFALNRGIRRQLGKRTIKRTPTVC